MAALKSFFAISLLLATGLTLPGCTQTPRIDRASSRPTPLTPAPVGVVKSQNLEPTNPIQPSAENPAELKPGLEPDTEVAVVQPPKAPAGGGQAVTREALVGAWQVSTGGSNCQIFLALTKWSGGYRAASRGCAARAITDVQAWDVKGKQVVLVNSGGGTAARLYRTGGTRYDGSTASGGAISFTR